MKFQVVNNVNIYPIEYLAHTELTDNDLNNLLDNNKIGLKYSLIIGMFKFVKNKKRNSQIIKMIKSDSKWFNKISWKQDQRDKYEVLVKDVYKNIYQYNEITALYLAQWFMSIYGLCVEGNKIDL